MDTRSSLSPRRPPNALSEPAPPAGSLPGVRGLRPSGLCPCTGTAPESVSRETACSAPLSRPDGSSCLRSRRSSSEPRSPAATGPVPSGLFSPPGRGDAAPGPALAGATPASRAVTGRSDDRAASCDPGVPREAASEADSASRSSVGHPSPDPAGDGARATVGCELSLRKFLLTWKPPISAPMSDVPCARSTAGSRCRTGEPAGQPSPATVSAIHSLFRRSPARISPPHRRWCHGHHLRRPLGHRHARCRATGRNSRTRPRRAGPAIPSNLAAPAGAARQIEARPRRQRQPPC